MSGFYKWLSSTKFQIAILCIALIYIQQSAYGLSAEVAASSLVKICLAYLGARMLEPIVEFAIKKVKK